MKLWGDPAMKESWTLIQSAPVVLSMTDQPCNVAVWLVAVSLPAVEVAGVWVSVKRMR